MRNNPHPTALVTLTALLLLGMTKCGKSEMIRWNVPDKLSNSELIVVRRFNTGIREIDEKATSVPQMRELALLPGAHKLLIQPEMWVSTFPMARHEQEIKSLQFTAKPGQCVYLCLGLSKDLSWSPFAVIVSQGENPRAALLQEMHARNVGCFSSNKMIPVFWLDD